MKSLLSVTGFTSMLTLLKMCSSFIVAKLIAVYAGPTGLAMVGQVQSAISIIHGIVNAPVGTSVVRYTAEYSSSGYDKCTPWWRACVKWLLLMMILSVPPLILFRVDLSVLLFRTSDYSWLIILSALCLPLVAANTLIASVINGEKKYKRFVSLGILSNIIATVITIILIYKHNITGALVSTVVGTSVSGLVMLTASFKQNWFKIEYWIGETDSYHFRKIGGYVLMATTSAVLAPLVLIATRDILVSELGWDLAGQWQAVWKISDVYLSIVTISISTYYLPQLSSTKGIKALKLEINKTLKVIVPIVCLIALSIYLLRDYILVVLFSDEFLIAREFFAIKLIGDIIKVISWMYSYPMVSRGATKWFISTEIGFSLVFVILCHALVGTMGVDGANLAYLINYTLYFVFIRVNFYKFAK